MIDYKNRNSYLLDHNVVFAKKRLRRVLYFNFRWDRVWAPLCACVCVCVTALFSTSFPLPYQSRTITYLWKYISKRYCRGANNNSYDERLHHIIVYCFGVILLTNFTFIIDSFFSFFFYRTYDVLNVVGCGFSVKKKKL